MFQKYSGEITGAIVVVVGILFSRLGIPFFEEDVAKIVGLVMEFAGAILVYVRRVQKPDVTPLGVRK